MRRPSLFKLFGVGRPSPLQLGVPACRLIETAWTAAAVVHAVQRVQRAHQRKVGDQPVLLNLHARAGGAPRTPAGPAPRCSSQNG
jgi:hypothetical protein